MARVATKLNPPSHAHGTTSSTPSVYDYENYREYLKDWFRFRKDRQPTFSGALFAKRAGLQSHSLLGMVIRGDRNLTFETIRAFSRGLDLSSKDSLFFEKLVLFNQAKHPEDQSFYLEQLLSVSEGQSRNAFARLHDYSEYLSHWYVVAIRELIQTKDFKGDPASIASRLLGRISKAQAADALKLLERLGFIKWNARRDLFEAQDTKLDIDPGRISFAIRGFHKECLRLAVEAIDTDPLERRQVSSVTLAVSRDDLTVIKRKLGTFIKGLLSDFPSKPNSPLTEVIQVTAAALQLTDITQSQNRKDQNL